MYQFGVMDQVVCDNEYQREEVDEVCVHEGCVHKGG